MVQEEDCRTWPEIRNYAAHCREIALLGWLTSPITAGRDACKFGAKALSFPFWPMPDLPMSKELAARLRSCLQRREGKTDLLFVNRCGGHSQRTSRGRGNYIRYWMHWKLPRGGFHSMRHGAAGSLPADRPTPAVLQRQLRHSDARITLGIYGYVVGDEQRNVVQNRTARLVN